jgi:hypothetical protein
VVLGRNLVFPLLSIALHTHALHAHWFLTTHFTTATHFSIAAHLSTTSHQLSVGGYLPGSDLLHIRGKVVIHVAPNEDGLG